MLDRKRIIKQYRIDKVKLTQQQFAEQLGYSHSYISKLESGTIPLNNRFLTKLYHTFDIDELKMPDKNRATNQLFRHWFLSLSQYHKRKSDHFLHELQKKLPITQATSDYHQYNLYRFYHAILQCNITEAEKLLPLLTKNSLHLTSSGLFLYYKAIAYYYLLTDQIASAAKSLKEAQNNMIGKDCEFYIFCALLDTKLESLYEANENIQEAQQLLRVDFEIGKTLLVQIVISINLFQKQQYEQAKEGFHQILDSSYHKEYMIKTELIYYYLAKIHYAQQNYEEALRLLRMAKVHEKVPHFKVMYLYLTAKIYRKLNRKQEALAYISNMKRLAVNQKFQYKAALLERSILRQLDTSDTKELLLQTIIPHYQQHADFPEVYKCYRLLQDICYRMKKYKQSADYLKEMVMIKERASNYGFHKKWDEQ